MKMSCSQFSIESQEPLAGTAPHYKGFLLVECPLPWDEKALRTPLLPEDLKKTVKKLNLRPQIIARSATSSAGPFILYVYHGSSLAGGEYKVMDHREISSLLSSRITNRMTRATVSKKVLLVCIHGNRDRCCGRKGSLLHGELLRKIGEKGLNWEVWQTSHIGGHRFAPNVAVFPEGRFYGRLEVEEVDRFIQALEEGNPYLPKCRGLSFLSADAQLAELWAWQKVEREKARLQVEKEGGIHKVQVFYGEEEGEIFRLRVEPSGEMEVYGSCGDEKKKTIPLWKIGEVD